MIEFKKYRDKPIEVKTKLYKQQMIGLWLAFPFMLAMGIFILVVATWFMTDETPSGITISVSGSGIIIYVVGALLCLGSFIILTFAILFTIWYHQCKKTNKTESRKVMVTIDKDNNITDLYRKKK